MGEPYTPTPPASHHAAITLLRVILWYLPSFLVPVVVYASENLTNDWFLAPGPVILIVSSIAYIERRLHHLQKRVSPPFKKSEFIVGMLVFAVAQVVMVPVVFVVLVFGYCMISDFRI